ncbi:centrosomal protein of 85 kDa isoform X2 [Ictidomys tridecemlineatus]
MESRKKECDSLQKIVEKQQQKIDQLCSQIQSLEQELAQEDGTSQALREEAQRRETALQQLRTAVKELSVQNQDLIEKNLTLQEQLRQAQPGSPSSPDTAQLAIELYQELASCLQDLQAVCSIVTQRAQGHDPNLSLLLGIHSTQHPGTQLDLQKPDVIRKKLEEVQQLRHDIEDLRTTMSDRYAQDMGENCATQ